MVGRRFFVLAALVTVGAPRNASAQDAPTPAGRHRVGADLGVASALGTVGVNYQFAPFHWVRLEGAVGWGPTGAQLSVMPKVALGRGSCVFTAGFGPSLAVGGQQAEAGHGPNPGTIPWLNLDVPGIECQFHTGFSFQATAGLTMPLAEFHYDVAEVGGTIHVGQILPQGRAGIGFWF
jgi:hypothetical protein